MEVQSYLDELIAYEQIKEQERIMIEQMCRVIPDVKVKVESALMYRWYKKAKAVYDSQGRMIPWTPEKEEENGEPTPGSIVDGGIASPIVDGDFGF